MKTKKEMLVFIVDDDPFYVKALENYLIKELPFIETKTFSTGEACLHEVDRQPDLVILDYFLNAEFPSAWNGIQAMKKINSACPYTDVIILSSQQNIEIAMEGIKKGAGEYLIKNERTFLKIKNIILDMYECMNEEEAEEEEHNFFNIILVMMVLSLLLHI